LCEPRVLSWRDCHPDIFISIDHATKISRTKLRRLKNPAMLMMMSRQKKVTRADPVLRGFQNRLYRE